MINVDGVEKNKSSKTSLYPVQLIINELPPHLRGMFIIVPHIFMKGEHAKFDDKILRPFIEEMNHLYRHGFQWQSSITGEVSWTQVFPFSYSVDAMMKPLILGLSFLVSQAPIFNTLLFQNY